MRTKYVTASCPRCQTTFDRLPNEGDCIAMPGTFAACCGEFLCACCPQVACDGCGQAVCAECVVEVPELQGEPLHCCAACALECEPLATPAVCCAYCTDAITAEDSQFTQGELRAHTRCANEAAAERAAWIAECDDTEGAAYAEYLERDRVPRKLAAVATTANCEKGRVA